MKENVLKHILCPSLIYLSISWLLKLQKIAGNSNFLSSRKHLVCIGLFAHYASGKGQGKVISPMKACLLLGFLGIEGPFIGLLDDVCMGGKKSYPSLFMCRRVSHWRYIAFPLAFGLWDNLG